MLILEDIDKIILSYSKTIYQKVKLNEELGGIIQEIISKLTEIYNLNSGDILTISQKYLLNQRVPSKINEIREELSMRFKYKENIITHYTRIRSYIH